METLKQFISENQINILGATYIINKLGKNTMVLEGKRGARYLVGFCPNRTVIEDKNVPVFMLSNARSNTNQLFGINNNEIVAVQHL